MPRIHSIMLKFTEEEKWALTEAAHNARMFLSAWARETLLGAAEQCERVTPSLTIAPQSPTETPQAVNLRTALELAKQYGLRTGKEIEEQPEKPRWTTDDSEKTAEARKRLFGDNPLRKLFPKEADFNRLAGFPWQKYDNTGRPLQDQHDQPILYE